ncbi:MAG: hypothetical protein QME51_00780 [Planctomycetota bacterium]|nr:hypothetical protein [Planctomycetota bacterium]
MKPNTNNNSELPVVDEATVNRVDEANKEDVRRFQRQAEQSEATGDEGIQDEGKEEGTQDESESAKSDETTEETGETGQSDEKSEAKEDSFVNPADLPDELKPAYKNMQAAFTKAMQGIPKEYRGEKFNDLLERAKAWDEVEGNPELVKVLDDHLKGKENRGQTVPKKEVNPDEDNIKELLPDATDIDRQFLKRYGNVFQKMIEKAMSPLADDIYAGREKELYTALEKKYGLETASLKPKIKALLKDVPDMTHEEAFRVVAFDGLLEKAKNEGRSEAEKQSKERETSFVAGGNRRSSQSDSPDFSKMTLAEMEKSLPKASRE